MSYARLTKGANLPLLFISASGMQRLLILIAAFVLFGCVNTVPKPTLDATGYLDDKGSVRIWRKDLNNIPLAIVSDYIPYNNEESRIVTTYEYFDGSLSQIKRQIATQPEVVEQLRFDAQNKLTFNQRVFPDRKEMIDSAAIEYLTWQAQQILQMSSILRVGKFKLIQGRYQQGQIKTCAGENAYVDLEPSQREWLNKQLKTHSAVGLAWLVSSAGEELLLMTDLDICASEPTLESL